ncbi:hypothetical protein Nepgr_007294 [Nepenthes gracilis]|uniref:Uncharacterized protein n=1 Tax=Nepenthes gracilis TaxID=150966 RepID=A0AAD3S6W9_NEPGR|nr:hypothetical protein Nepgr_007294 [Nepenthes gracilis]
MVMRYQLFNLYHVADTILIVMGLVTIITYHPDHNVVSSDGRPEVGGIRGCPIGLERWAAASLTASTLAGSEGEAVENSKGDVDEGQNSSSGKGTRLHIITVMLVVKGYTPEQPERMPR